MKKPKTNSQIKTGKIRQRKNKTKERQNKITTEKFVRVTLEIKYLYKVSELEMRF